MRKILTNPTPIFRLRELWTTADLDPHWTRRVRWFLLQGNFRRSFEEWKKAAQDRIGHYSHSSTSYISVSFTVLEGLVNEIWEMMTAADLLSEEEPDGPIALGDKRFAPTDRKLAKRFCLREASDRHPFEEYSSEGVKLLLISAFFRHHR
ncbi:MAG: hypothetical protein HY982_00645 [Candidatus Magasanikbacteria bacterium]|nr:hypothetical protein [Candidatus Magasanikbacteria bacterium]